MFSINLSLIFRNQYLFVKNTFFTHKLGGENIVVREPYKNLVYQNFYKNKKLHNKKFIFSLTINIK